MIRLAVETTTHACSVALDADGRITAEHVVEPQAHSRILLPMIDKLMAGRSFDELDAIVLGNGPGSFIGMRIGTAVVQGIAFGAGLPVVPVSSLAAIAAEVFAVSDASRVAVLQDARMDEVYFATFRRDSGGRPLAESAECLRPVASLRVGGEPFVGAGGGWTRYPDLCETNAGILEAVVPIIVPQARFLLAVPSADEPGVAPEAVRPAYLRTKVAEKPPAPVVVDDAQSHRARE